MLQATVRLEEIVEHHNIDLIEPRLEVGACDICGRAMTKHGGEYLYLDRCPVTGVLRGYLCANCDAGLQLIGDTLEAIDKARAYLTADYEIKEPEFVIPEGECSICGRSTKRVPRGYLYMDADPETYEVRGYLCMGCNIGLDLLGDNITALNNARDYVTGEHLGLDEARVA